MSMWTTSDADGMSRADTDVTQDEGISCAIARAAKLQKMVDQGISKTSMVHCSGDRTLTSLNRERESLLLVRDHLEVLENKLREIRCMESREISDQGKSMRELDNFRHNLLEAGRKVISSMSAATGARNIIAEVIAFVDGESQVTSPSPLGQRDPNVRHTSSPLGFMDLTPSPLDTSFMKHRSAFTPPTVALNPRLPIPGAADDVHGGRVHIRNYGPSGLLHDKNAAPIADSMSELYADLGTSCATSQVTSRAQSMRGKDATNASVCTGHTCTRCGTEIDAPATVGGHKKRRPLRWLFKLAVVAGVGAAAGQNEWVRSKLEKHIGYAAMGREFNTREATEVPNGLEAYENPTLSVWPPPDVDAGRG